MKSNFANRVKQLRLENKYNQNEIESFTGIDRTTISLYENGLREPNIKNACVLADFYKVTLDYLFGRSNRKYLDLTYISEKAYKKILFIIRSELDNF